MKNTADFLSQVDALFPLESPSFTTINEGCSTKKGDLAQLIARMIELVSFIVGIKTF